MAKRIFDTSYLIDHWRKFSGIKTPDSMTAWAEKLIDLHGTRFIVTPVFVEMVAGATSPEELKLPKAYLHQFEVIDKGKIPKEDWDDAIRLAQRVSSAGGTRQLGDCLIRAIANRLRCDVSTFDKRFPSRANQGTPLS